MGIKTAQRLLQARDCLPTHLGNDVTFDVWFLPLILDSLEPVQSDLLKWLLANGYQPVSTVELSEAVEMNVNRAGAALSDLRRLGLVTTTYFQDGFSRNACHTPVEWARDAWKYIEADRTLA